MLLNKKYSNLLPTSEFILDEVILLNAWKKSQQHIRGVNWYIDCIDLDRSAVELEENIILLTQSIESCNIELNKLELIPAPKSHEWSFIENKNKLVKWYPKGNIHEIPMRPLAHIGIMEQTLFTALMILLANTVETKQGDPSTSFESVHKKKIISYGNRLHCKYLNSQANYSWGNSNTYSKYFQDYQQFLARPIYFGRLASKTKAKSERIYEVHLDFSKFYDSIDRALLNNKIRSLIEKITLQSPDKQIEHILSVFESWQWTEDSKSLYIDTCSNQDIDKLHDKKGVPQGLVAGGFFANIYMLDFDQQLANLIGKEIPDNSSVTIIDACRYVDDLRMIIKTTDSKIDEETLKVIITDYIDNLVNIVEKLNLTLQHKKTKVKRFSYRDGSVSSKLANIQAKISGPMPLHELDEQLGHLEGLIELSDNLNVEVDSCNNQDNSPIYQLATIEKTFNDVRKDTLLRFTANKIHLLLRQKRNMISQEVNSRGDAIPGQWDFLQERMSKKLLAKWSQDPSLVLLLKKGLELFPDISTLLPVLNSLDALRTRNGIKLKLHAEYCISEILRHSATVIHAKERWAFPAHADIDRYFSYLENYATDKLKSLNKNSLPLRKQALFFCLVKNDFIHKRNVGDKLFDTMSQLISGFRVVDIKTNIIDLTTAIILSNQIASNKEKLIRSILSLFETISKNKKTNSLCANNLSIICEKIAASDSELFEKLYFEGKKLKQEWINNVLSLVNYLCLNSGYKLFDNLNKYNNTFIALLPVARSDNNPLRHENGILKIIDELLNTDNLENPINIANTKIHCSDWDKLLTLDDGCLVKLQIERYNNNESYLYHKTPKWLTKEHKPLYHLGIFIRSCLLGTIDWCGSKRKNINSPFYHGVRTNGLKKQISMIQSPEFFGDSYSPMSDWLSSLLFTLLQWPGVNASNKLYSWPNEWTLQTVHKCVKDRIKYQRQNFCTLLNIPSYTEKVHLDWPKDKKSLKVVMAQPIIPKSNDFSKRGLKLDSPSYRATHRRHIASVAELILHKIASLDSATEKPLLKGQVDLIVWPELSISKDDIDILERLSDKTGAIIFAGLVFHSVNNEMELNNAAIWIIPSHNSSGRRFIKRLQGKHNMTRDEVNKITPWRPYQLIIELMHPELKNVDGFKLTGSICYDATDIKLNADLKSKSNAYIISAMNKDVSTFDSMVDALYYHMYQYIVLVNSGEFGGSVAKAPYRDKFNKLITHSHGSNQVSISLFEMNMFDFRKVGSQFKSAKQVKTEPAGV